MEVIFHDGRPGACTHMYPANSGWVTTHHNMIAVVDGDGREMAVYDRGCLVCIRHAPDGLRDDVDPAQREPATHA